MGAEFRVACLVAALAAACGGHNKVRKVQQPTLERVGAPPAGEGLGSSAAPGFLRACETRAAGAGLIELSCDEHQLVEFRKVDLAGVQTSDQDLEELMGILAARFGELKEERSDARIDASAVRLSRFSQVDSAGVQGIALVIDNLEGNYWGLACYRKGTAPSEDFCGDAIATAARAGGLAHVEARAMREFGEGKLLVPEGCESSPGRGISCSSGKLSWSAPKLDALALRAETIENLQAMADKEKVTLTSKALACTLLEKSAECHWLRLHDPAEGEELNFVLAIGGQQGRLVVCTFPSSLPASGPLPEPCAQALRLDN